MIRYDLKLDDDGETYVMRPNIRGRYVHYWDVCSPWSAEREAELATKIEQVLKDAGPMENRDATLKSILELLK